MKLQTKCLLGVIALLCFALFGVFSLDLSAGEVLGQLSLAAVGIVATKADTLQKRATASDKATAILKRAKDDGDRDLTDEEDAEFNRLCDERDGYDAELKKLEKREGRQARATAQQHAPNMPRGIEPASEDRNDPVIHPDRARYSILRAIRRRAEGLPVDGYEGEISQEIARRMGKEPQSFFLPLTLPARSHLSGAERRDFDTTAGTGGIPTILAPRMIDALRNRIVMTRLGAQLLTGMIGNFSIPKLTGTGSAYWVAEGSAPTESAQSVGQVSFTPKTLGAFTDITRKLMLQSSIDAEQLVMDDLMKVIAIELDRVGLNGSGSGAEPTGIMQNGACPTVALGTNGAAPTWDMLVDLETNVGDANIDVAGCAYVTSPVGRGKLKKTLHAGSTAADYLWDRRENTINGYPTAVTKQIPKTLTKGSSGAVCTAAVFGDFTQAVYAMWGALDLLVDPYTSSTTGTVRIVALQDVDFQLRNAAAFAKCVDMLRT